MGKVVINASHGMFALSDEAVKWMLDNYGSASYGTRHDEKLVRCVEALGVRASNSHYHSRLQVKEFSGNEYIIDDYDGYESVMTPDMMHWVSIN